MSKQKFEVYFADLKADAKREGYKVNKRDEWARWVAKEKSDTMIQIDREIMDRALVFQDISRNAYADARRERTASFHFVTIIAQKHAATFAKAARKAMGLTDSICHQ